MKRGRGVIQTLSQGMASLVYPTDADCLLCGAQADIAPNTGVCRRCWQAMPGAPPIAPSDGLDWTGAAVSHEVGARELVHRLKFSGAQFLARGMGERMASAYLEAGRPLPQALVPVPLGEKRLRERGFNQAELLCRWMGRALDVPVYPVLKRRRETLRQATLGRAERVGNIRDAFEILSQFAFCENNILIVDDVITTSGTVSSCANALKSIGIQRIAAMAFAYRPYTDQIKTKK